MLPKPAKKAEPAKEAAAPKMRVMSTATGEDRILQAQFCGTVGHLPRVIASINALMKQLHAATNKVSEMHAHGPLTREERANINAMLSSAEEVSQTMQDMAIVANAIDARVNHHP